MSQQPEPPVYFFNPPLAVGPRTNAVQENDRIRALERELADAKSNSEFYKGRYLANELRMGALVTEGQDVTRKLNEDIGVLIKDKRQLEKRLTEMGSEINELKKNLLSKIAQVETLCQKAVKISSSSNLQKKNSSEIKEGEEMEQEADKDQTGSEKKKEFEELLLEMEAVIDSLGAELVTERQKRKQAELDVVQKYKNLQANLDKCQRALGKTHYFDIKLHELEVNNLERKVLEKSQENARLNEVLKMEKQNKSKKEKELEEQVLKLEKIIYALEIHCAEVEDGKNNEKENRIMAELNQGVNVERRYKDLLDEYKEYKRCDPHFEKRRKHMNFKKLLLELEEKDEQLVEIEKMMKIETEKNEIEKAEMKKNYKKQNVLWQIRYKETIEARLRKNKEEENTLWDNLADPGDFDYQNDTD